MDIEEISNRIAIKVFQGSMSIEDIDEIVFLELLELSKAIKADFKKELLEFLDT